MENKPENISKEWFTVIKLPILKIAIGDQVFLFSPTRRINTPSELFKVLKEDAWRIIDSEKPYQAKFFETARLFDYLSGQEATISVAVLIAEAGWKQRKEKARQIPINFHVTLHDKIWNKEKEITSQSLIEVYSLKAEVRIVPSQGAPGYQEEVIIEGKKLVRLHGLFATYNEPFTSEDDPIFYEVLRQTKNNSTVIP
uniref:Uncharacterized protein n=1 Tax=Thermofilum adornatum TaxID=1365176 RepID=A0A7C1CEY2_9CREN